jgi:cell division protein FtsW
VVLVPGLGHVVNGSRRWLHIAGLNFQVSEAARVLALIYVASYAVRYEADLRGGLSGVARPLGLLAAIALLLLLEPDFGAGCVLFLTGFGVLFLAGAQWRWIAATVAGRRHVHDAAGDVLPVSPASHADFHGSVGGSVSQRISAHAIVDRDRSRRPVRRRVWAPACRNCSICRKLTRTSCSRCWRRSSGLAGVAVTLGLFLALAWRAFVIARRAQDAGLKFQSYLASGFGLWLAIQAFINVGVNMGVLPTKGLTLPFMSYGRSSLIVTLAWLGILLRVHHETVRGVRRSSRSERT